MNHHESAQEMAFMLLVSICQKHESLPSRTERKIIKRNGKETVVPPIDVFSRISESFSQTYVFPRALLAEAFNTIDEYKIHQKKKRKGGYRTISEPPESLKKVQQALLKNFFYRIVKRFRYYNETKSGEMDKDAVFYRKLFLNQFDNRIHGSVPKRSCATAIKAHCSRNAQFVVTVDLKDAYPSVTLETLKKVLGDLITEECKASFVTYQRRKLVQRKKEIAAEVVRLFGAPPEFDYDFFDNWPPWEAKVKEWLVLHSYHELTDAGEVSHWHKYSDENTREIDMPGLRQSEKNKRFHKNRAEKAQYPKYSLFPAYRHKEFRTFIRQEAMRVSSYEKSKIPQVMEYFVSWVSRLCCHNDVLPQGAPTSGFMLNLIIWQLQLLSPVQNLRGVESVSIYVDDIVISTSHKPTAILVESIKERIAKSGLFSAHPYKMKTYDLRKGAAQVLGTKLARTPANDAERAELITRPPAGFIDAVKSKRHWYIRRMTLSKKKQKQYRALLHRVSQGKASDEESKKAIGYHGHIVSIYGWGLKAMPASLKKVVSAFRSFLKPNKESS